ncbi:hypothetical protein SAMN05216598_5705 [Pseudomonas asplenii]|uniref:Uncharacterized protein n=2 Tax=Pseudomonas asplenii TaxID=53407 RepID=A0A1H2ABN4_9PSED|nr:hypothetical protein SAMN05216598_5705 [Pseudomonas asplenii]
MMRIENNPGHSLIAAPAELAAPAREQRVSAAEPAEQGFEDFYQHLLARSGSGEQAILQFIGTYRGSGDGQPDYHTVNEQLKVVGQALARFKEEGLAGSDQERELRGVMTRLLGSSLFINQYMHQIFQPPDDDSWENADW